MPTMRAARRERGWTAQELGTRSGLPAEVIVGLEGGTLEHVSPEDARAIADALRLDASTIYELQPSLGLTAVGETGSGEDAATGAGEPG